MASLCMALAVGIIHFEERLLRELCYAGPGGTMMQTCAVTGGTYGTATCTDDCGGYYKDGSTVTPALDQFMYRYYIQDRTFTLCTT